MNDYQSSKLVDLLPPPALNAGDADAWIWIAGALFALLLTAAVLVFRSSAFARFRLRRQIARHRLDSRQAAARISRLADIHDARLQQRLQAYRFGPTPADRAELLEILRRLP